MKDESTARVTRLVVFAFWSVVLVGLPFWWKTTEVYRASLPFSEIDEWQANQACDFILPSRFTIYIPTAFQPSLSDEIENKLTRQLDFQQNFPISIHFEQWSQDVESVLQHTDAPIGNYFIYIKTNSATNQVKLKVGDKRTSVLEVNSTDDISTVLSNVIPPVFFSEYKKLGDMACHSKNTEKNDVANMRALKYSTQYETTFSLMNNNPDNINVDWDIRESVNTYLRPFLNQVSVVSNFTINSQIQNYAALSLKPKYKERENRPNYYYFEPQHLPHFVNSAEWNLASTITSHPSINFILYIPSSGESPLRIHDSQGNPLLTSAFLIPRWGGIVIKNPPKNATELGEYRLTKKELQSIIKIFISQLRSLVGIQDIDVKGLPSHYQVEFEASQVSAITTLEKDNLIRSRTIENIVNSISTLKSLSQLVDEIPNMVVQDHINDKVRKSLAALDDARKALETENDINALQQSIRAIELAEKAFFDPTMVSMLYFPDEHKYAIYMPLFVPISVPLVMALLKEIKKLKQPKLKTE